MRVLSTIVLCIMLSGCAHCSRTVSDFDGKTAGINPYGSGTLKTSRVSYWGTKACVNKMIKEDYDKPIQDN